MAEERKPIITPTGQPTTDAIRIRGQISKVATESRGSVQVVISVPLHLAAPHGTALLSSYGQNVVLLLEE